MPKILQKYKQEGREYIRFRQERNWLEKFWFDQKMKEGWRVENTEEQAGKFKAGKTIALGLVFLPLALFGKGADATIITISRELKGR